MRFRILNPNFWQLATLAILTGLLAAPVGAATGDHIWSLGYPVSGERAIDGSDHFVTHGNFFGTIDLGGGPMTSVNFLQGDQYIARFDATGNHLWSVQITPTGNGITNPLLAVDPTGNIYITGHLFNGATVDYGGGTITGPNVYVAKFDTNGNHLWSAGYGDGRPKSIAADNSNVVVTGYTSVGVDFGGLMIGNAGGNDVFVAQLTSAGAHAWSKGFGDASDQGGMAVTIDGSGNVLLVGSMFGTVDFGGGGEAANGLDLFLASFTSTGAHTWSQVFDGLFTAGGGILVTADVATGPSGEVAICGEMLNSVDFGGGMVNSNGFGDMYVAVFDSGGNHQWSAAHGSTTGTDQAYAVSIDGSGNVLATGNFKGDTDFGGGTIIFNGGLFDRNIFVALYDASGTHLFSQGYGINAGIPKNHFDSADQMLIYGRGGTNIDLGGGPISPESYFVAKLEGAGGPPTAIDDVPLSDAGDLRVFPNPFNPTTTIEYMMDTPGHASISVYDARGRLVEEIVADQWLDAGRHRANFVAGASGVYFVQLRSGAVVRTIKTVAIK